MHYGKYFRYLIRMYQNWMYHIFGFQAHPTDYSRAAADSITIHQIKQNGYR